MSPVLNLTSGSEDDIADCCKVPFATLCRKLSLANVMACSEMSTPEMRKFANVLERRAKSRRDIHPVPQQKSTMLKLHRLVSL